MKNRYLYLVIALVAFILNTNTLGHGFVYDDAAVLKTNTFVQQGLSGLGDIFSKGSWDGYDASADMHIYRPLQLASLALQYELFGMKPFGYHLVHVATYALACCLIFTLLQRLFRGVEHGRWLAFLTTLIYAAHPVHSEVVAYGIIQLSTINKKAAIGIGLLLMVGYSGYTIERNMAWKSNLTLMETDVRTAPRNSMANRFLVTLYLQEAENGSDREANLWKAAHYQERFLELAPNDAAQHHKLGGIYEKLGEPRKAAEAFKKVAGFVSPLQAEAELRYAKNCNADGLYRDALPI